MNTDPYEVLRRALTDKCVVRIVREKICDYKVAGIPLRVPRDFVALSNLAGLKFDGLKIIPLNIISNVDRGATENVFDRIVLGENLQFENPLVDTVNLESKHDLFSSLESAGHTVIVEMEQPEIGYWAIGRIARTDTGETGLVYLDEDCTWDDEPFELPSEDLTCITLGDGFCTLMTKYAALWAEQEGHR